MNNPHPDLIPEYRETGAEGPELAKLPRAGVEGLYVHVPFCFHKCHYCDFYSITRQTPQRMGRFVDLVLKEAGLWGEYGVVRPRTVFFGGGTPSLLPRDEMRRLIGGLRERFDWSAVEEFTVEVNPATAEEEYCGMMRECGVDRLSFGAQSFDVGELKTLERHHEPGDVMRSVEIARGAGFERLNADLIYAIPGQSLESWERSLECALALGTSHISCYNLTYEPNTPMAVKKRLGQVVATEEATELEMFRLTRERLRNHERPAYEVSNYAAVGEECRHNLVYWTGGNYIGLGPSAASHIEGHRWRNRAHLGDWEQAAGSGELPAVEAEVLPPYRRAGELAMLLVRLARGLNFEEFADRTGLDARVIYADQIERLARAGLINVSDSGFALLERGFELADAIGAELLDPETGKNGCPKGAII